MARLLLSFPTPWDDALGEREGVARRGLEVVPVGPPSDEVPYDFDVLAAIDDESRLHRGHAAGVTSSSDYPGATVAAALAARLGLPGSPPAAVLGCSHKYLSRRLQREVVPEATPGFVAVDSADPRAVADELAYPVFVKPVKGAFSVLSRRLDSPAELLDFFAQPAVAEFAGEYMRVFDRLLGRYLPGAIGGRFFLAEELLGGHQVTVEGFVAGGEVTILGIVDSLLAGGSFVGFVHPSALAAAVQERMVDVARRLVAASGLDFTLWNLEMIYDPASDRLSIIEVNPRMCGQFADLYAKVDGHHGYDVALALALGERPELRRGAGEWRAAASFPLRTFEPVVVARAPTAEDVAAAEALFPGTRVWLECETGWRLDDFARYEDGHSARYGIVNLGGDDRDDLERRLAAVVARLGIELMPIPPR